MGGKGSGRKKKQKEPTPEEFFARGDSFVILSDESNSMYREYLNRVMRDGKPRLPPEPGFNWEAVGLVAVICLLIFFGGYVLPSWYHDFEQEHYNKGYAAGTAQLKANVSHAFTQGIEMGKLGYSVYLSSYWYSYGHQYYANDTHIREIDQNGDTIDEYG